MHLVPRTCSEIPEQGHDDQIRARPQLLAAYQNMSAYVLLGDPGAGKTEAFKKEARQADSFYVTARDLLTFEHRPEWHGKTLFIDGLDEMRAGSVDGRTPFDGIRARLDKLGRPRFRLACREADWFGASDREHIRSVSADRQVTVLRLEPLSEADIAEILRRDDRIPDADEFIRQAQKNSLKDLLSNPQILRMLVDAVAGGNWPKTRKQTFELACETIIREHNREHINATRTQPLDINQQVDAAGFLCAVQLIADKAGYALTRDQADSGFPELNEPAFDDLELLQTVVRTKLFTRAGEERVAPVHRHVAEYLGARHLARRVDRDGLPVGRVLALITGDDGVVVTALRGLSAWLATLCTSGRKAIIDRDPLGVVLYGDVQEFSAQDKRRLLEGLRREADRYPWFRSAHWTSSPFGALATPDMEPVFHGILTAPDRSDTHQALADCVLDALTHGVVLPGLAGIFLDMVRDATWRPRIRLQALEAFRHNGNGDQSTGIRLRALLTDIGNGDVPDPDDELLGYLLTVLYPQALGAAEVVDNLHTPKQPNLIGSYRLFWDHHILDRSSDFNVSELLDTLVTRMGALEPVLDDHHFHGLATRLLARGLEAEGAYVDPQRLYDWLGVGLDRHGSPLPGEKAHTDRIRDWLDAHPDAQKTVIDTGLRHCVKKENFDFCIDEMQARLFHAEPPSDFGYWCLEKARTMADDRAARFLLTRAVAALIDRRGDAGLSLEILQEYAERNTKFKAWLADLLVRRVEPEHQEHIRARHLRQAKEKKEKRKWLDLLRSHETALREGRAPLGLLHDLATAYFGHFIESQGDTPIIRLRNFLNHDEDLLQATLEGLRRSVERDDVPQVTDIIRLYTEDRTHLLARPFLAGLAEITSSAPSQVAKIDDERIRQAVAFHLTEGGAEDPDWYKALLTARPNLVANVLVEYATASLRSGKPHVSGLYALAYINDYAGVARSAALPLLTAFPVRSTAKQLGGLDELLTAALRYTDVQALLTLVEKKLALRSMNVAQRVRWLAAGLIAAPGTYLEPLANYTEDREPRIRHLAGFLAERHDQWSPLDSVPVPALGLLVRLIGRSYGPYSPEGAHWVSPAMNAAEFVSRMIAHLGTLPDQDAGDMLAALLADDALHRWHTVLSRARYAQRAAGREASFRHPDIRQVSQTLRNRSPANVADLAALITDVLRELARRIRHGGTDDYRQYWNEDPRRRLTTSKHEDACRDALLSDLQQRLAPLGIDAQPEGHYADDKRADIRAQFQGFNVPVEIKKNSHTNLWRAIRDQLIAKYTRDPGAHGFGIYLVFWFGADETQLPPSGPRPRKADELEKRLRAILSVDEARMISICVIDVAKPE